jgi:2-polyprenyl-6-methoxyphenol hydroxylase-like FAD-dependent oxidoreductase
MSAAIVIGAGPAGSIAALLLARSGFAVDLFESHQFPRDKVCGECLSGVGQDVLRRAGVLDRLNSAHPAQLTHTLLHPTDGSSIDVPLPRVSMGISRLKMDMLLLAAAKEAGVSVHQPARCEDIQSGDKPSIIWRDLLSNTRSKMHTDWIVVADGKGALLPETGKLTGDLGIKSRFENVKGPNDAIELFAGRGHYGGLAAVEDDCWNAAFSVPASLVKKCTGDLQQVFNHLVECNPTLKERVATARRVGPWLASPLPRFAVSGSWPMRVVPVGNAAAALEPVGGEGMGLALRSAELAVNAIVAAERIGNPDHIEKLPGEFQSLWRIRRTVCRGIAMMFSRADLADALAPLISANLSIPAAMMRWAGKAQDN